MLIGTKCLRFVPQGCRLLLEKNAKTFVFLFSRLPLLHYFALFCLFFFKLADIKSIFKVQGVYSQLFTSLCAANPLCI